MSKGLFELKTALWPKGKRWLIRLLILLAILLLIKSIHASNFTFRVTHHTVESPNIPNAFNEFKIAQISDLHGKLYGEDGSGLTAAIEEEKPDIVVVTGDLLSRSAADTFPMLNALAHVSTRYPTYYILGNHEREWLAEQTTARLSTFYEQLRQIHVTILANRTVPIIREGKRIMLAGLQEDMDFYRQDSAHTTLPTAHYLGPKTEYYTVLLAHNPLYWPSYISWGADLTLSGHIHGGGIRLPLVGGVFSPEMGFAPKYDRGLYREKDKMMVVSAGLANSGTPFRLFNPQELVIIELKSQSIH